MIFQMWNGAWNKLQLKVCQVAQAFVAYFYKHSTLDPVMVSVVSSNPTGGNFLKILPLDVNFGLKCKCDLIVKNSYPKVINHIQLWMSANPSKNRNCKHRAFFLGLKCYWYHLTCTEFILFFYICFKQSDECLFNEKKTCNWKLMMFISFLMSGTVHKCDVDRKFEIYIFYSVFYTNGNADAL